MATIKLKKPATGAPASRPPVRGAGARQRPTLAQAQAQRAERAAHAPAPALAPPAGRERPPPEHPPRERAPREQPPRAQPTDNPARAQSHAPQRRPTPAPARPALPRPASSGSNTAFSARPRQAHAAPDAPAPPAGPSHAEGSMRLSKRMSELGLASRREADEWIARGWVRVDGAVFAELGARVLPGQQVSVDKKAKSQQARRVTILIHKPIGYVSGQAEDGYEPASVLVVPANRWRDDPSGQPFLREHLRYLAPAGRLDIDSVGLLVLTQDGRVAKQLIGTDSEIEKEYLVRVEATEGRPLGDDGLRLLNHGLELDGEPLKPARVEWVNDDQLRFVLTEGKKRQIRRMCDAVGLKVTGLKRVRIGRVMLGDLPAGQWRYLREDESFA
jgi:23S rRNA pseudouridine2604 synthase